MENTEQTTNERDSFDGPEASSSFSSTTTAVAASSNEAATSSSSSSSSSSSVESPEGFVFVDNDNKLEPLDSDGLRNRKDKASVQATTTTKASGGNDVDGGSFDSVSSAAYVPVADSTPVFTTAYSTPPSNAAAPSPSSSSSTASSTMTQTSTTATKILDGILERAPESMKPALKKFVPFFIVLYNLFLNAIPVVYDIYLRSIKIKETLCSDKYRFDLLIPSFIGLSMCFFGGTFVTVIAAVEAYRMIGYDTTLKCLSDLYADITAFIAQNEKDDKVDNDGDGVADVNQIDSKELITRKSLLFLKTVNPDRVTGALAGINAGFLAVAATLKLQFAKAITLGSAIASMLNKPATKYVLPLVETSLPVEYRRWARPLMEYFIASIAISFAWTIQRIISCFHSATRGGLMFSRNFIAYLNHMNYINLDCDKTNIDEIAGYFMAFLGISFQLTRGFNLPFPMNLLLFPFTFLEWFLVRVVLNSA